MSNLSLENQRPLSREEIVETILRTWTNFRASKTEKNIIGVVGHAGIGKSWVVREFYKRVRSEHETTWPSDFESGDTKGKQTPARLIAERRLVAPSLERVNLRSISGKFAWIGITCDGTERYLGGTQVQVHLDSYESFYVRLTARKVMVARFALVLTAMSGMFSAILEIFTNLKLQVQSLSVLTFVILAIGLFSVSRDFRDLFQSRGKASQRPGRVESSKQSERLNLVLKSWSRLLKSNADLIVFVDDAHEADAELVKLLEIGLQSFPEMFIVYTARWSGDAATAVGDRNFRNLILSRLDSVEEISISTMSDSESQDIVKSLTRGMHKDLISELVRHSGGNPLVLVSSLASPSLRQFLSAGSVDVEQTQAFVEILMSIPADAESVLAHYWMQLPEPLRELASWAALQGLLVIEEALLATCDRARKDTEESIGQLSSEFRWLQAVESQRSLWRFVDAQLWRVSERPPASHISPAERRKAAVRLRNFAREYLRSNPESMRIGTLESSILVAVIAQQVRDNESETTEEDLCIALEFSRSVAAENHSQVVRDTLNAIQRIANELKLPQIERDALCISLAIHNTLEIVEISQALSERLIALAGELSGTVCSSIYESIKLGIVRSHESERLIESLIVQREFAEASRCAALFDDELSNEAGFTEISTSQRIRFLGARAQAGLGRLSAATRIAEDLIGGCREMSDNNFERYLLFSRWRLMRLYWQLMVHNSEENLTALKLLVDELARAWHKSAKGLGLQQFELFLLFTRARQDYQAFLLKAGHLAESLSYGERLLLEVESRLGRGHFESLTIRGGIASALTALGRFQQAISNLKLLIRDRIYVYGESHNMVFNSRRSLCEALFASGDAAACVSEATDLEAVMKKKFGNPGHPDLLRHQITVVRYLVESGLQPLALERISDLKPRIDALLEESDPLRRELDDLTRRVAER